MVEKAVEKALEVASDVVDAGVLASDINYAREGTNKEVRKNVPEGSKESEKKNKKGKEKTDKTGKKAEAEPGEKPDKKPEPTLPSAPSFVMPESKSPSRVGSMWAGVKTVGNAIAWPFRLGYDATASVLDVGKDTVGGGTAMTKKIDSWVDERAIYPWLPVILAWKIPYYTVNAVAWTAGAALTVAMTPVQVYRKFREHFDKRRSGRG